MTAMQLGEGYAGDAPNVAHVNTMLGTKDGPVGAAWATALATPRAGHTPFVVVVKPNVPVQPMTLFVNKATVDPANERHATLTWGAAQAGVAAGVVAALHAGVIDRERVDELVLVVAVWVDPAADDAGAIYENNEQATLAALRAGRDRAPTVDVVLAAGAPENPYFRG
jgi:5,6,7,8-tetrahydromethanopterin hydro-lyase